MEALTSRQGEDSQGSVAQRLKPGERGWSWGCGLSVGVIEQVMVMCRPGLGAGAGTSGSVVH